MPTHNEMIPRMPYPSPQTRRGTILILVAAISGLLASLALTFLLRNRSDAQETASTLQDVQSRIMLVAAMNYIQECSRIGWDRYPAKPGEPFPLNYPTQVNDAYPWSGVAATTPIPIHEETFGWIDVRDGSIGPRTQGDDTHAPRQVWSDALVYSDGTTNTNNRPRWPAIGGIARCPMYVWKRPPYATRLTAAYNPIETDPGQPGYLMPYLTKPDPQAAKVDPTFDGTDGTFPSVADREKAWAAHVDGDKSPLVHTTNKSWFRVLRDGPTTFVITCGAGATQGFRSYKEAEANGQQHIFQNDPQYFAALAAQEIRLWYRVEWSASSAEGTYHWQQHHLTVEFDSYLQWPLNASHSWQMNGPRSPAFDRNMGGTFRWHMRLRTEPTYW